MKPTRQQECKSKHGMTAFRQEGQGIHARWRCKKCNVEAVSKRRKTLRAKAIEYKGGKCKKCGYNKCPAALDFHHRDPSTKSFGISSKGMTRSFEKIKEELDKCDLICANCHREIHYTFQG